jgi:hypothetical protein
MEYTKMNPCPLENILSKFSSIQLIVSDVWCVIDDSVYQQHKYKKKSVILFNLSNIQFKHEVLFQQEKETKKIKSLEKYR